MFPQKFHFDEFEQISLGQSGEISGRFRITGRGILQIRIEDDHGWIHRISIPKSIDIPGLPMLLTSS